MDRNDYEETQIHSTEVGETIKKTRTSQMND